MTEQQRYIGGPPGGIPEHIFEKRFYRDRVKGLSGTAEIFCNLSPDLLLIGVEESRLEHYFKAAIDRSGGLQLDIKSRDRLTHQHRNPDIYAGALVRRFMQYATDHGKEIKLIYGNWGRQSVNFEQFRTYLDTVAEERSVTKADEIAAANTTWTGKLANSLGYTDTMIVNDWRNTTGVKVHYNRGV